MASAIFVFEGTKAQAAVMDVVLRRLFEWIDWKHVVNYELGPQEQSTVTAAIIALREVWWPLSRRLLQRCGPLDSDELERFASARRALDAALGQVLGNDIERLRGDVDMYFTSGYLPVEWIRREGFPLCLYAPFYRFAKPQDMMCLEGPPQDGSKLFIAPTYTDAKLSGVNRAVAQSVLWVGGEPSIVILDGRISSKVLEQFGDHQFARLAFHGHAGSGGLLASDGTTIPFTEALRIVRGPAFLLGCATGGFETGALRQISDLVPRGVHGALLNAFPASSSLTRLVNEIIVATFREPELDARRVQDIAHMSRLALGWLGILYARRALSGAPLADDWVIVTPFEANYEKFSGGGAGVARLARELRDVKEEEMREVVLDLAAAFSMSIVSCGTPAFLRPGAHPASVRAARAFIEWDGRA